MAMSRNNILLFVGFTIVVLTMPIWLQPFGAAYPDLLQRFMIFGIFAVGFNILLGLTGYLSLRRLGIYFSILTLAFAQMSCNLAYSVLTPITNGET
ncbi:MAG: branched-chain amino acid ABC transporter permease, partial [Candidatus Devosia euplotis]|nr:branched-chain amino acid ABC transporter permease [Candidatus Devosia euplotis]